MKTKISLFLGLIFSFILMSAGIAFSQEKADEKPVAQELTSEKPPLQEAAPEPETQWIWGDVVSVDTAAKKISVKYLDYETDTEKDINVEVDDKTNYENVKSIDEIKPLDTLSIDYIINPDGRNIAKNISIERPEGAQTLPMENTKEEPKAVGGLE